MVVFRFGAETHGSVWLVFAYHGLKPRPSWSRHGEDNIVVVIILDRVDLNVDLEYGYRAVGIRADWY